MKHLKDNIEFVPQFDQMDCGPACISLITSYYGKKYPLQFLREHSYFTREGVSLLGIIQATKSIGLEKSISLSLKEGSIR